MTARLVTYTLGRTRDGRYWWHCGRPHCDTYQSGHHTSSDAQTTADRHQLEHERGRR